MSFSIKTGMVVCLGFLPFAQSAQAQDETVIQIKRLGKAIKPGYQAKMNQSSNPQHYFQLRREGMTYIYVTALDDTLAVVFKRDIDSLSRKADSLPPHYWNATEETGSNNVRLNFNGMHYAIDPWGTIDRPTLERVHIELYNEAKHGDIEFYPDPPAGKTPAPVATGEHIASAPVPRRSHYRI